MASNPSSAASSPPPKQPKVLMFDIGGVCVNSPFQAILDYEVELGIPPGWVNYSISRTAPNGWWHRLERGEVPMDDAFFRGFNEDLRDQQRWREFYARQVLSKKRGPQPRLHRPQPQQQPQKQEEEPQQRGSIKGDKGGDDKVRGYERDKTTDLAAQQQQQQPEQAPPVPDVDGEWLFNNMMTVSATPDPWMYPALRALKASGRYILAALSNTVIFPPGHPLWREDFMDDPVRRLFDVFISSAHVGLRKPDARIYQLALARVDEFSRQRQRGGPGEEGQGEGVAPGDIVFLDDIGENLKHARLQGFRTVKVPLGRAYEAVDQLEALTGLALAGPHPRIPHAPTAGATAGPKAGPKARM